MDLKKIEKIIGEPISEMEEISYGYTNKIYSINGKYILKVCVNENNYKNFQRASEFCKKYYGIINCPRIVYSCLDVENKNMWQIEEMAKGVNLSFKWGKLTAQEKDDVINKICESLRQIHSIPIEDVFEKNFSSSDWKEKFRKDIAKKIASLEKKGLNYEELYNRIKRYVEYNVDDLNETNFKICHTDMHFDNILIDDENNITILDYDRLRISSLDYELNIFNIMEKTPSLVVNSEVREKIKKDEYSNILSMLSSKYKEMSDFKHLETRLNIYALKQYLGLLGIVKEKDVILDELNELINAKHISRDVKQEEMER